MASLKHPSPIVQLKGFSNSLIYDDVLHVAYRGFGPEFIASALCDVFGKARLTDAFELSRTWARAHDLELSIDEFVLSEDKFPSLNAKGADIKVLSKWLVA